ncbi:MAG: T9SS type A sorting domain-containing protein [Sphingobacteriales bacterium]|nr:T9SS type A sorting domain-containing protein [Sphingobacteriales bacterium]
MKRPLFVLTLIFLSVENLISQDLPGPTPNLQILPSGSYVIAMDNTNQLNSSGFFNLKSYGLIVHLLNQYVKVKRVILSGKAKDAIDFSVDATKILPVSGSSGVKDFKAGPFVVFATDTSGVAGLVQGFNNQQVAADYVSLYVTNADVTVDVRHTLSGFVPKAAILDDGGNQAIHVNYMTLAGITTMNYAVNSGANLLDLCFTFASEPHNGNTGITVDTTIARIRNFVQGGGNFLAQCEAINNYENNPLGRFQSTNGITVVNKSLSTSTAFPNPDLAYNQFEGSFNAMQGGSVRTWKLATGSTAINNMYHTCDGSTQDDTVGTTVAKLIPGTGGMVFYIGNHTFTSTTDYNHINGIRMYMNAFVTPVAINNNCSINQPLFVRYISFEAARMGKEVKLTWKTGTERNNSGFAVERNIHGIWEQVAWVPALAPGGNSDNVLTYIYTDINNANSVTQYRLRQVDSDGRSKYSEIRFVRGENQKNIIIVYPNPCSDGRMTVLFDDNTVTRDILITDMSARTVRHIKGIKSTNITIENLAAGIFTLRVIAPSTGEQLTERVVVFRY